MKNIESLLQEYGGFHHASVACGGDFGTADQSGAAYDAVMEAIDNHHSGLQDELNAARALLREALESGLSVMPVDFSRNPSSLESRVSAYLDACDKPGEPT